MMHRSDFSPFWRAALRFSARLCASFGAPFSWFSAVLCPNVPSDRLACVCVPATCAT
jgi:hypothetical protein